MIPVVVLTGFLGAGKTTQLNGLIDSRPDLRVGVVENEAGEIGVDGDLIDGAARVVEVTGGCACCTVRGALTSALDLLAQAVDDLDAIVIEASGIADPIPIIGALQAPSAREAMRLSELVCVVDAAALAGADLLSHVWAQQLSLATAVVLTKTDLVNSSQVDAVRRRIRDHNRDAPIVHHLGAVDRLLDGGSATVPSPPHRSNGDGHGFSTVALHADRPLDAAALDVWLGDLFAGGQVLRIKGAVIIEGLRRGVLVQATPEALETAPLPAGSTTRRRLVLIGHHLDRDVLQAGLDRCGAETNRASGPERPAKMERAGRSSTQ